MDHTVLSRLDSTTDAGSEDPVVPGALWDGTGGVGVQDRPAPRGVMAADRAAWHAARSPVDHLMTMDGPRPVEAVARERAWASGPGDAPPAVSSPAGTTTGPESHPSPSLARAAALLADAVARPAGASAVVPGADPLRALSGEAAVTASPAGQHGARAAEALLRFAQAGVGRSAVTRDTDAAGVPSPVVCTGLVGVVPADASSVAGAAPAPLPEAVRDQVLHQLVSSLKMQWKDGIGEAKLHLRPDALGAVSVSLRVEGGAVTAVVRADSPQVQEWVVQHQQTLRQQMEAAGLRLDDLVVTPDDERQGERPPDTSREHRRRRQPVADPTTDAPSFDQLL
jgi:hypothetical protein